MAQSKGVFIGFFLAFLLNCSPVRSQDPAFSQYYASGVYLSPALAGIEPNWALNLNYRSQWRSIGTPYITSQVSFIYPFHSKSKGRNWGGLGISVFNDRAGDGNLQATGANFNLAYNVYLSSKQVVIFGVQGGFIQKNINFGNLQWGSQYDPFNGFNSYLDNPAVNNNLLNSSIYPDIGAGFLYYYNADRQAEETGVSAFAGASAYHLNQPNESLVQGQESSLPMLIKAHGGIIWGLSHKVNLSPNVLFALQNSVYQVNSGLYITYMFAPQTSVIGPTDFITGAWYRLDDSFIFLGGFGNDYYTLGFSYDLNSSSLRTNTRGRGAYEISLKITKPHPKRVARFHTPRI